MKFFKEILTADIKCTNVKIKENVNQEGKTSKEVESAFLPKTEALKQVKEVSVRELTIVARADSMMIFYADHLEAQAKKLDHVYQTPLS